MRRAPLLLSTVLLACSASPRTQVMLVVTADDSVIASTASLRIVIEGGPSFTALAPASDRVIDPAPGFPLRAPIIPAGGDASRVYQAVVTARDASSADLVTARARSGFVSGRTLELHVHLSAACVGTACSATQTCLAGACADAYVDPLSLPPYGGTPDAGSGCAAGCDDAIDCTADDCVAGACTHSPDDSLCTAMPQGTCDQTDGCRYPACTDASCVPADPCETAQCVGDSCMRTSRCAAVETCCDGICFAGNCSDLHPCQGMGAGTPCRPANGPCDVEESCDGSSPDCPPNGFATGTPCRPTVGMCDLAESCDGTGAGCPTDVFEAMGVVCRPSAGPCDLDEACAGGTPDCSLDGHQPDNTPCPVGVCTAGVCGCPVPSTALFVTDRRVGMNRVMMLTDLNGDGDAMDMCEGIALYSENGGPAGLNNAIAAYPGPSGAVYVVNANGTVLRLRDADGDHLFSASEGSVFYSGGLLANSQDLVVGASDNVFVADAGGAAGNHVIRLRDVNADGDALDPGEAVVYADTGPLRLSIRAGVIYTESSNRLQDLNMDGDALDAGETTFYGSRGPLAPLGNAIHWGSGRVYLQHRDSPGPNQITELVDSNGDGDAADFGEATLFGTYPGSNSVEIEWDLSGRLFATDAGSGQVVLLTDPESDRTYTTTPFATGMQSMTSLHLAAPFGRPAP